MQIDQKKVPVFHGEKDKDTITVLAWCHRIDGMKDALGWSDGATYANAMAALFGVCPEDGRQLGHPVPNRPCENMDIPEKENACALRQHD